jgi:hypothetical protein
MLRITNHHVSVTLHDAKQSQRNRARERGK